MQEIRIHLEGKRRFFAKDEYIEPHDLLYLCKNDPCQAAGVVLRIKNLKVKALFTQLVFHCYNKKPRVQSKVDVFEDIVSVVTAYLM